MNRRSALALYFAALATGGLACSDDTTSNTGGAPQGGSSDGGNGVGPTTGPMAGPTTGTGGMVNECMGLGEPWGACGACVELVCCDELQNVLDNAEGWDQALAQCAVGGCDDCATQTFPVEFACDAPATPQATGACVSIGGAFECNPVTNEGCDGVGASCDNNGVGFNFACFASGNVNGACEPCGASADDFCLPGLTCVDGICTKYCCSDADCGSGTCATGVFGADADLGVCAGDGAGGGGTGGAGGAGDGGAGGAGGTGGV